MLLNFELKQPSCFFVFLFLYDTKDRFFLFYLASVLFALSSLKLTPFLFPFFFVLSTFLPSINLIFIHLFVYTLPFFFILLPLSLPFSFSFSSNSRLTLSLYPSSSNLHFPHSLSHSLSLSFSLSLSSNFLSFSVLIFASVCVFGSQ